MIVFTQINWIKCPEFGEVNPGHRNKSNLRWLNYSQRRFFVKGKIIAKGVKWNIMRIV